MNPFRLRTAILALACLLTLASAEAAESPRRTPVVRVVEKSAPSVVNIGTESVVLLRHNPVWGVYGPMFDDFLDDFAAPYGAMTLQSLGSGVIVSEDGLIVTNAHVVHMASRIIVTLSDGRRVDAELVGTNAGDDLALIRVRVPDKLKPVRFAEDVIIGETVVAIGNPFGLENSVSAGVVSGTNRKFFIAEAGHAFEGLVQSDVSINPGSSGGALLNLEGKLVGINLAVLQQAQSISFAIPVEKLRTMMEAYRRHAAETAEAAGNGERPKN